MTLEAGCLARESGKKEAVEVEPPGIREGALVAAVMEVEEA